MKNFETGTFKKARLTDLVSFSAGQFKLIKRNFF